MFDSIFAQGTEIAYVFLMAGVALLVGLVATFLYSLKIRSTPGFFVTAALIPLVVSSAIAMMGAFLQDATSTTARIVTIAVCLGLIRFRSAQGKSEEMLALVSEVITGLILGLGFLFYGAILGIVVPCLYIIFVTLPVFKNKRFSSERLLKITIPESLDYSGVFDEQFAHYLKDFELVEVKTTGMGSMYRLSYRVIMKNQKEEKEFIDELRIRNGNLEISMTPYVEPTKKL